MKMSRCERRCEDEQMFRRCEDEKMFYRPPLLEEPCAQTLSGKSVYIYIRVCICLNEYLYTCIYVFM